MLDTCARFRGVDKERGQQMPNQRRKGNKQISIWLTASQIQKVEEAAQRYDVNKTELLKLAIDALLGSKAKEGDHNAEK